MTEQEARTQELIEIAKRNPQKMDLTPYVPKPKTEQWDSLCVNRRAGIFDNDRINEDGSIK